MERKFKEAVVKACYAEDNKEFVNQIMSASHQELIEKFVLPRIIRGWRISPMAVKFVTEWINTSRGVYERRTMT